MGELVDMGLDAGELEAMARMPPALLVNYRHASLPHGVVDAGYEWVVELRRQNPRQFSNDLARYEREWREAVAKLGPVASVGSESGQVDAGECLKLSEKWLLEEGGA